MAHKLASTFFFGAILAGCSSGGPGTAITPGPSTDRAAGGPESASSSGDPGVCAPCAAFYQCAGMIEGVATDSKEELLSSAPSCASGPQKNAGFLLACGGTVLPAGATAVFATNEVVGTWKDLGAGILEVCFGILGSGNCLTCAPTTAPVADKPGVSGNGNGNNPDAG